MNITPEMTEAWSTLQKYSATVKKFLAPTIMERAVYRAIDVLDNSDFMVPVEEAGREAEASFQFCNDPAEWGDTACEAIARHQGLDADREAILSERMFRP